MPAGGADVAPGTTIALYPATGNTYVPELAGLTLGEAVGRINEEGLILATIHLRLGSYVFDYPGSTWETQQGAGSPPIYVRQSRVTDVKPAANSRTRVGAHVEVWIAYDRSVP